MNNISKLNEMLVANDCLYSLNIKFDESRMAYDLVLELSGQGGGENIIVTFFDVSGFTARDFGGGLIQLMHMNVKKIERGLDRIHYQLVEVEDENLSFYFSSFSTD